MKWSPSVEFLAQMTHLLGGLCFAWGSALWLGRPWIGCAVCLAWAVPKELWWDVKYEPDTYAGGLVDLAFYALGAALGTGLTYLWRM